MKTLEPHDERKIKKADLVADLTQEMLTACEDFSADSFTIDFVKWYVNGGISIGCSLSYLIAMIFDDLGEAYIVEKRFWNSAIMDYLKDYRPDLLKRIEEFVKIEWDKE
jgi:hypothetical protein